MKHMLAVRVFAVAVLTTATFMTLAQTSALSDGINENAGEQPVTTADADARLAAEAEAKINRHCLRHTGSRLVARASNGQRCVAAAGRVYTREDLDSTGAVNLADALRMLDASFR